MKKRLIAPIILALLSGPSWAQEGTERGTITFFRPRALAGYAFPCPIRYKGQQVVELARGKYAVWKVPPGKYILANNTASVTVNVESGKSYYVRCLMKPTFFFASEFQETDKESFDKLAPKLELKLTELSLP